MSKILVVNDANEPNAGTYHRQIIPFGELVAHNPGVQVDVVMLNEFASMPDEILNQYSHLQLRRAATPDVTYKLKMLCQATDTVLVYDIDDDKSSQKIMDTGSVGREALAKIADVVTVSTEWLAEKVEGNTVVLPNRVKWPLYRDQQRTMLRQRTTVGFAGTKYHNTSLSILMRRYVKQDDEVVVVASNDPWVGAEDKHDVLLKGQGKGGWIDFRAWPSILAQIDVQSCFLFADDVWTLAKSELKQAEALASGAIFVGSTWKYGDWNPYNVDHMATLPDWRDDHDGWRETRGDVYQQMIDGIHNAIGADYEQVTEAGYARYSWAENPPTDYEEVYL